MRQFSTVEAPFYGNESLLAALDRFALGRWPHTILLLGPEGSGRHTLAKIIAGMVLCREQGRHTSSDRCLCCQKILRDVHPDFITLTAENKSGALTVRQLRDELVSSLPVFPHEAEKKIYFCASPLAPAGQNLLLKSLEEPPEHTIFLLSGTSEAQFLDTVRSRAVPLQLSPLSEADLRHLIPRAAEQPLLYPLSGGWAGQALSLSDEILETVSQWTDHLLCALLTRKEYDFLAALEQADRKGQADLTLRCAVYLLRVSLGLAPALPDCAAAGTVSRCAADWSAAKRCRILSVIEDYLSANAVGRNKTLRSTALAASLFSSRTR